MDWFIYNALKGIGGVAGLMWLLALVYGPYACAFEDCSNLSGWWVALWCARGLYEEESVMGMFDYVSYDLKCDCGETFNNFQSKDGPCELRTLSPLQVDYFYGDCPHCGEYHSFDRSACGPNGDPPHRGSMADYGLPL